MNVYSILKVVSASVSHGRLTLFARIPRPRFNKRRPGNSTSGNCALHSILSFLLRPAILDEEVLTHHLHMRSGSLLRWAHSPTAVALLAFLFIYLGLVRYCSHSFYRDPTSAFFDPTRGYKRHYSLTRQEEAETFIENSSSTSSKTPARNDPQLCIGIATVGRDGEQYVRSTIGSLLDGLTPTERAEIYLVVLIAHTTPNDHPIYAEQWLTNVVDKVLLYNVDQHKTDDLMRWELDKDYRKKAIFDYTYVLQNCHNRGSQWIAMIEDDTLAVKGWYPKAIEALEKADALQPGGAEKDWLYLRLFFTEEFLGWNSEEWPRYLLGSIGVVGMAMMVLLLIRLFLLEKIITNSVLIVICLVWTPACILLYFLAGRLSVQPLSPGVYQMPRFGCCAQGLIFSDRIVPKVISRLALIREGFVDEIIEAWANEGGLIRWVSIPSLLQHIGGHSSKGDDFGSKSKYARSVAEKIWSFGFEMYHDGMSWMKNKSTPLDLPQSNTSWHTIFRTTAALDQWPSIAS